MVDRGPFFKIWICPKCFWDVKTHGLFIQDVYGFKIRHSKQHCLALRIPDFAEPTSYDSLLVEVDAGLFIDRPEEIQERNSHNSDVSLLKEDGNTGVWGRNSKHI